MPSTKLGKKKKKNCYLGDSYSKTHPSETPERISTVIVSTVFMPHIFLATEIRSKFTSRSTLNETREGIHVARWGVYQGESSLTPSTSVVGGEGLPFLPPTPIPRKYSLRFRLPVISGTFDWFG